MKFWLLMEQTRIAISLSLKNQKVSETNFLILKIFRWLREVLFSLDLFSLQIRVSEKDRENLHYFFTDRQNWNTLTRFLCQVFFIDNSIVRKEFHGSASISMIHFWRESKAMSRRKSIIVKVFSIKCLQWIANLGYFENSFQRWIIAVFL